MNKQEFLKELKLGLSGLSAEDIEERLGFYSEMIDDRTEDGLSEEDAILEIGNVNEIVGQIIAETPIIKLVKEKVKPKRRLSFLEIVLLVLGSPLWVSIVLSVFAVIISVYVSLWSVVISIWATFVSLIGMAIGGIVWGSFTIFTGNTPIAVAVIGLGIFCLGLSVFAFLLSKAATKGMVLLTKLTVLGIKNALIKKEAA